MITKTLRAFGFIGAILIVVIFGLGIVIQGLGAEVHELDDAVFQSRLDRMELQYYDLLIDCHDPAFVNFGDVDVDRICEEKLPQIYAEYQVLVEEAKTRE